MGVLGEMFPRKRIQEDSDAAQGGEQWRLGPIDLDQGVVTVEPAAEPAASDAAEDSDAAAASDASAEDAAPDREP